MGNSKSLKTLVCSRKHEYVPDIISWSFLVYKPIILNKVTFDNPRHATRPRVDKYVEDIYQKCLFQKCLISYSKR